MKSKGSATRGCSRYSSTTSHSEGSTPLPPSIEAIQLIIDDLLYPPTGFEPRCYEREKCTKDVEGNRVRAENCSDMENSKRYVSGRKGSIVGMLNRPLAIQAEREQLRQLVEQWNENRLDLFNLSYPTEVCFTTLSKICAVEPERICIIGIQARACFRLHFSLIRGEG